MIVLTGLLLLGDAVVGQIVEAGGVNHRVRQGRRLRGREPHGSEVDDDGGEEESEDSQADGHHLPAAVEEAGPRERILLSESIRVCHSGEAGGLFYFSQQTKHLWWSLFLNPNIGLYYISA